MTHDPRAVAREDIAEQAYWDFDARRKGYSVWTGQPQSERDAFKAEFRNALADERRRALELAATICEAEALIDDERGYYGKEMAKAIRAKAIE